GVAGAGAGLDIPVTSSLFDVRVDLSPVAGGGLAGRVEFDTDLFDRVSMEWLVGRLVGVLGEVGAGPGWRVGAVLLVAGGVVEVGAMYLPVDGAYPPGRVGQVLGDAHPVVVVTRAGWAAQVDVPVGATVVAVDVWPDGAEGDPGVGVDGGDGAYVIYTSGS